MGAHNGANVVLNSYFFISTFYGSNFKELCKCLGLNSSAAAQHNNIDDWEEAQFSYPIVAESFGGAEIQLRTLLC